MKYEAEIKLPDGPSGITVDGDGDVDIVVPTTFNDITISLTIEEIKDMLAQAEAHRAAWDAYQANDYEDIVMPKIGQKAKPDWGRNAGKWGEIVAVKPESLSVLIEFAGNVQMSPTADPEQDTYWSSIKKIKFKD